MTGGSGRDVRRLAPLAGIRVLALEQAVAAPLCTRHLADLGAEVIKVERRDGGDFARHYDAFVHGESACFVWLNPGKQSVALDLRNVEDRRLFDALLSKADVFVHNLPPGAVARLGLEGPRLHRLHPRLVYCGISGYGGTGPYRDRKAFDLLLQGEAGVIATTGSVQEPAKVGISIADISGGMYAFSTILAALLLRERTGRGSVIDISMLECLAEWMALPIYLQLYSGAAPVRSGVHHFAIVPYGPYRTADNAVVNVAVQNDRQWQRFCAIVLGANELTADPRFARNDLRLRNRQELEPMIAAAFAEISRAELLRRLEAADIPYGFLNNVAEVIAHPQLAARRRWTTVSLPDGSARALRHPMNIAGLKRPHRHLPRLGEHQRSVERDVARPGPLRRLPRRNV